MTTREDSVARRNELKARELFYSAERGYRDPRRRLQAEGTYAGLLRDYLDTGVVLRAMERISRRAGSKDEYYYAAADMWAGGTFRLKRAVPHGLCWEAGEETEFGRARENFVEIDFTASADAPWRCWILAGGCCADAFVAFYQASELTAPDRQKPKEVVRVEPGSIYALTLAVPASARKPHASHSAGEAPKDPLQWEWIEVPLPRFSSTGPKRVRLVTNRRGLHVAKAVVSASRRGPPSDADVRALEEARTADLGVAAAAGAEFLGHWAFDEGGGKVAGDASGNGCAAVVCGNPSWVEGKYGAALRLGGKDDFVVVGDFPAHRLAGDFTLSFWVRLGSDAGSRQRLVGKGDEDFGVWCYAGRRLLFQQFDSQGRQVLGATSKNALGPGAWHHVAAVLDGRRGILYLDGAEEGNSERGGVPVSSPGRLTFGGAGQRASYEWSLDDVRVYGRALSAGEIRALAGK